MNEPAREIRWRVLHLRPRTEKKMREHCQVLGLNCYLPLRSETKVYQRRKVTVEKPVFPGYIFVAFKDAERTELLRTNHIVRIIEPDNQRQLLHELAQIRKALRIEPSLGAGPTVQRGRHARITSGPFMGIEGMVSEVKGKTKILLNVDLIGQAVVVEIDRDFLDVTD